MIAQRWKKQVSQLGAWVPRPRSGDFLLMVTCSTGVHLAEAIGYVPPAAVLEGRRDAIHEQRDKKLAKARLHRIEISDNKNLQDSIAA